MEEQSTLGATQFSSRPAGNSAQQKSSDESSLFDSLAIWSLLGLTILLPIFFIPSVSAPFQFTKTTLAGVLILAALIFWVVARLQKRELLLPMEWLFFGIWSVPIAYILSSVFSGGSHAFLGYNLSQDTTAFMLLVAIAASLVTLAVRTRSQMLLFFMSFLVSFGVLVFFHFLRFIVPDGSLSFGVFLDSSSGPFGLLSELGMFFGLVCVLSLVTSIGLRLSGWPKILVLITLTISLLFLIITNVTLVWWLVGFTALGTFVFSALQVNKNVVVQQTSNQQTSKFETSAGMFGSLLVLAIALVFVFAGQGITSSFATWLGVGQLDIRPSWQSTYSIGKEVYSENLFFGSGPGHFSEQWSKYRPSIINQTIVWNTDFNSGIGYVPTSMISTGLFGVLAWLAFFGLFLWTGVRTLLLKPTDDVFGYYLSLASFIAATYTWVLALMGTPNATMIVFAFLLTGLFLASMRVGNSSFKELAISFDERPRVGFVIVLTLTVLVLGSVASLFTLGERYTAATYFQHAVVVASTENDIDRSLEYINKALVFDEQDRFYRLASNLDVLRLSQIVANNPQPNEEQQAQFQARLARAIDSASRATQSNPANYQNWLQLGSVYQAIIPLGIEGASESAKRAFGEALVRRPNSPRILLSLAQVSAAEGNIEEAKNLTELALRQRPNYSDAIFLLAQLQISEGDIDAAIRSVEAAVVMNPGNPVVLFQLGLLRYSQEDYQGALSALESAVRINPEYANARYFLGLSQYWLGATDEAVSQFRTIKETNQDNEEIDRIISNMTQGLDPFTGAALESFPPEEATPDITELDELPIEEDDPTIGSADEAISEDENSVDNLFKETSSEEVPNEDE